MAALSGEVAIVTGAGRGFGRAIAERFAREGASVCLTARSRNQLDDAVAAIVGEGGRAMAVAGDATAAADVARVVRETETAFGPVTLLVSNAGTPGPFGPLWHADPEAWWAAQALHIKAPLLFMHAAMPGMIERRRGRVIVVSALAARWPAPYLSAYCTGKIAQTRMVEIAALEAKDAGVAVFAIDPGFVFTGIAEETMNSPEAQRWLPFMVERMREAAKNPNATGDLERCAQRCVDLASGKYDALSGRYLELPDDLDAMLTGARPHWQKEWPPNPAPNLPPSSSEAVRQQK